MRGLNTKRLLAASAGLVLVLGVAACGDDDDDGGGGGGEATARPGDRGFNPPHRRSVRLRPARAEGSRRSRWPDQRRDQRSRRRPHGRRSSTRTTRRTRRPPFRLPASWSTPTAQPASRAPGRPRTRFRPRSRSRSRTGSSRSRRRRPSPSITEIDDEGLLNRTSPPDTFQGPTLADAIAEDLGGADGQDRQHRRPQRLLRDGPRGHLQRGVGRRWAASIGQEVIYDPEQPSYNSEAGRSRRATPTRS